MRTIKEKLKKSKNWIVDHRLEVIVACTSTLSLTYLCYLKGTEKGLISGIDIGYKAGIVDGFEGANKWWDQKHPEFKIIELWEHYKKE